MNAQFVLSIWNRSRIPSPDSPRARGSQAPLRRRRSAPMHLGGHPPLR